MYLLVQSSKIIYIFLEKYPDLEIRDFLLTQL